MLIKTSDNEAIKPFVKKLAVPHSNSHKGQNGRVLIIGGSSLFHAASIWAAETASHFVDIIHYSSTRENEEVFLTLKKKFKNGIIVPQKDLESYAKEDDAILIGPGMMRDAAEGKYTHDLTKSLIKKFPEKRFVFDAGSLQVMSPDWLCRLQQTPIITPHQLEFEKLFGIAVKDLSIPKKTAIIQQTALRYKTVILLKAIVDIISDGHETYIVEGGNAGLTKGGTGDTLAGLAVAFFTVNRALEAAVLGSIVLKKTADLLYKEKGYWYNVTDIVDKIPNTLVELRSELK